MRYLFLTALAGLMVSCGQNSDTDLPVDSAIQAAVPAAKIISVARSGNPDGRTIVLIPGLASSAAVWAETTAHLETDHDVRTIQVAGFAGAPRANLDGGFTDAISKGLTDHLSNTPGQDTILVGHSMGGFVAMKAGIAHPELIDEVVIVDSLPYLAGLFMPNATPDQAKIQAPAMAEQMKAMSRKAFDRQQSAGLSRLTKTKTFRPELEAWGKGSDQEMVADVMAEMLGSDLRPEMSKLTQPVTVFAAFDPAMRVAKENVRLLYTEQYALAPNSEVHVIEDSFHFIMKDQPSAFQAQLDEAIRD